MIFLLGHQPEGARLFSAAAVELRQKGIPHDPADTKWVDEWKTRMRDTLGEEAFSKAMAEGENLSYEEAVAEMRKWLEDIQL